MAQAEEGGIEPLLVRAARAGITLRDLADLLEVSEGHLRNIRDGRRRLTPDLHRQILAALDDLGADIHDLPRPAGDQ